MIFASSPREKEKIPREARPVPPCMNLARYSKYFVLAYSNNVVNALPMTPIPFTIRITGDVSEIDVAVLQTSIKSVANIDDEKRRVIDPATVIIAFKLITAGAGAATALAKLAQELIKWKRLLAQNQKCPAAELNHADSKLQISTATDSEITEWLQQFQNRN